MFQDKISSKKKTKAKSFCRNDNVRDLFVKKKNIGKLLRIKRKTKFYTDNLKKNEYTR